MQANPSNRWKTEIVEEVIPNHDFGLVDVYDAGSTFRQDDHQCDFCGSHLRYTAIIAAEDDTDIEYEVGLDCLEHTMGTKWSHLQDVERRIKELKEEAARQRRKEAFAEEYEEEIEWLERRLEIQHNDFLQSMYDVLTTGESKFSKKMHEGVLDAMENTDLDNLQKKEDWLKSVIERLEELLDMIENSDKNDGAWSFVNSVLEQTKGSRFVSDAQLDAINDIYDRYENYEEEQEEEEDAPPVPF